MHLADAFIQRDLQWIQAIHFLYVCSLGTFCAAYTKPQEHNLNSQVLIQLNSIELLLCVPQGCHITGGEQERLWGGEETVFDSISLWKKL